MPQKTLLVDAMGRPLNSTPTYIYHPKGIGRIYWRGQFRNLPGDYNSPESLAAFHRMCQHVAITGELPAEAPPELTVASLCERFEVYAAVRYSGSNEARNLGYAVKELVAIFADVPAVKFGPASLKVVRARIVERGLCRATANRRAKQIVQIFAWAVEEELIGPDVWQALKAVRPIPKGRDGSFDYDPIRPVDLEQYRRTIEAIAPHYRVALEVQRMTGMRSGELLAMRPQDVDMLGTHWFYRPVHHKTRHAIGDKIIGIPEPAAVLLVANMPKDYTCRWFPWRVDSHYHAVCRVCDKLEIPRWHPHRLRHNAATIIEQAFGSREPARILLGHTNEKTTGKYVMVTPDMLSPLLDGMAGVIRETKNPGG